MQIDLSKTEIELIDKALEVWEKDPMSSQTFSLLAGSVLCPTSQREEFKAETATRMKEGEKEVQVRRMRSVMLRAKLFQGLARESEHDLSTPA